ncbi:HD domain-containing protein [bacterium]|nr:HD domain-containing protein [bacterium]
MKSDIYEIYKEFIKLKGNKRRGWYLRGIKDGETIAEHSFSSAALGLFFADQLGLDENKVVKMALIHEFCEIITGDITPVDGVSIADKRARELKAAKQIFGILKDGGKYISLWKEFEFNTSKEGQLVKDIDKLEMALQAIEYDKEYNHFSKDEFIHSALDSIKTKEIRNFLLRIIEKEKK